MPDPYYSADGVTLHLGDSLNILPTLADSSVDAVVCDPPYEIGIAGRDWDRSGIAYNVGLWAECLRVLKPGGHLLSFGAPKTYHRMACAVEDAGFRIVDQLDWIYIHGKPKGTDLARASAPRRPRAGAAGHCLAKDGMRCGRLDGPPHE
jgi:DNA modification methylase